MHTNFCDGWTGQKHNLTQKRDEGKKYKLISDIKRRI